MGVLRLNNGATNQDLRATALASVLQNLHYGAHIVGGLIKLSVDNSNWHAVAVLEDAVTAGQANIAIERDNSKKLVYSTEAQNSQSTTTVTGTTDTWFYCCRKPDGNAAGTISLANLTTAAAMTHETGSVVNEPAAGRTSDRLVIGHYDNTSDAFVGWQGLFFAFDFGAGGSLPNDTQIASLITNKRTSDIYNLGLGTLVCLVEFTTLTPTDLAGNATSWSASGSPTIDSGETLAGWNFNGTGGGSPTGPVLRRRRAAARGLVIR